MKNKKSGLVLLLVFVLLMGGAYVLYDRLGADISSSQMLVHATQSPENKPVSDDAVSDTSDADVPEASVPAENESVSDEAGGHAEDAAHALPFVQPQGAHDAYKAGEYALWQGKVMRCTVDGCAYAPDAYPSGWEAVE